MATRPDIPRDPDSRLLIEKEKSCSIEVDRAAAFLQLAKTKKAKILLASSWLEKLCLGFQSSTAALKAEGIMERVLRAAEGYEEMSLSELLVYQRLLRHLGDWVEADYCISHSVNRLNSLPDFDDKRQMMLFFRVGQAECYLRLHNSYMARTILEDIILPSIPSVLMINRMEIHLVAMRFYIMLGEKGPALCQTERALEVALLLGGEYIDWALAAKEEVFSMYKSRR
jgi:hypothetical protein